ncbi:MAG: ASCH domain-containing protein [Clostridia bacterium]|nr:ASCH domain-containing protein [Clostridia bacterium]
MKLAAEPYELIASGKKTVEVRLYDEKRKQISVGDTIEFFRLNANVSLTAKVVAVHRFDSFRELFASALFPKTGSGDLSETDAADTMYKYYTKEQESHFGVLGIEIVLI